MSCSRPFIFSMSAITFFKTVDVNVKISGLTHSTGSQQARILFDIIEDNNTTNFNQNSTTTTANNYAWGTVDGLKITMLRITLGDSSIADWGGEGKVLEISKGYNQGIELTSGIAPGSYDKYNMELKSEFDVKAYTYTDTKTVYTTAAGVVTVDGKVDPADFQNYDYYHYDFLYVTNADSPTSTTDSDSEGWNLEQSLEITEDSEGLTIQLLIDTYNLVAGWDGTGSRPETAPFSWTNNHGYSSSDFYPDSTANFGISYIPMYLSINDPGTTIGEVYIVSTDESKVAVFDDNTTDFTGLQHIVMVFSSQGEYTGSRVVGFDAGKLSQYQSGVTVDANGTYTFYNGEYHETGFIQDRKVVGFKRTALGSAHYSVVFSNGPDAYDGTNEIIDTHHPEWGTRNRELLTEDIILYVKRVK